MSRADVHRLLARATVGFDYDWGGVLWRIQGGEDKDPLTPDCSGLLYGLWNLTDTHMKKGSTWVTPKVFFGTDRPTSRTMYAKATPIAQPERYGDLGFRKDSDGVVKHVLIYIGRGQTVEAGYHGPLFDLQAGISERGSGHVGLDTVEWQNSKGVVWGRIETDLGELTPIGAAPTSPFPWWPEVHWAEWSPYLRLYKALANQIVGNVFTLGYLQSWYGYFTWRRIADCREAIGLPRGGQADREFVETMQRMLH